MTVGERLRELDRNAGFGGLPTEEQWRAGARRWRWLLVIACIQVLCLTAADLLDAPTGSAASGLGFAAVWLAFTAGRWKSEDDWLSGREGVIGGRRRPASLGRPQR